MSSSNSNHSNNSGGAVIVPGPPESSPVGAVRRGLTPAQMDSIGGFESDLVEEKPSKFTNPTKEKQTPPPSPPPPPSNSAVEAIATTVDVGRPVSSNSNSSSNVVRMEIDQGEEVEQEDDFDADLERLLGSSSAGASRTTESSSRVTTRRRCCASYKIGNTTVLCPRLYEQTGLGLMGPHWFGPLGTLGLLLWASHHFITVARTIGPISHAICICFTVTSSVMLFFVSCGDPGIVRDSKPPDNNNQSNEWRWCDFCNVYQPPDGSHCPDCNVCVEGYDHHCVWMGTCVGRKNFAAFKWFNLSWLFYLIYSIVWVTILGPKMFDSNDDK